MIPLIYTPKLWQAELMEGSKVLGALGTVFGD
jgi:hypothetical protein